MVLRLLRGRVAVRPLPSHKSELLTLPDSMAEWDAKRDMSQGIRAQSSHRGIVLGMGDPALEYERHERPWGFGVGDEVVFTFGAQGTEQSRNGRWVDDQPCVWIAAEEVQAVIE